ncbi:MAG: nuclear transport factor 2 family protein [Bradyrhizobium sp.]|uniref:YybH family protein n=1 Tax=Bradyrhizobium sp. TaxID=376 RepID=UPI0023A48EE3|nr:nuclear transport factor 2 family protein [Bradyrhizobium sp.]MDE2601439.1 nuclear transport factor 2 family protein [Bradyrhizobium sp.]
MRWITLASLLLMASAAAVRAEDVEHTILSANEAFDKAWSTRDITAIDKLWSHEPYVFVVHPSSKAPEMGWENVRTSFGAQMSRYSEFAISMTGAHVHVNGDTAVVVGLEAFAGKRVNGDTVEGKAIGTRGFERKGDQWLVVFHQATPVR